MSQLYSGFGRIVFLDLTPAVSQLVFAEPVGFTVNTNSSEIVSYKQVDGVKVPAGAKQGMTERTCQIKIEAVNRPALELALGVRSAITNSLNLVELRFKQIPATGTAEIVDADIGAALGAQVHVVERGAWGDAGLLTLLATGSPATGQFRVDAANNKLIFNSAQAGATIAYTLIKNYTGLRTIGKEQGAAALATLGFEGLLYTENANEYTKIVIPKMIKTKSPSFNFGEKTELDLEYRMVVATGQANDHYLVEMPDNYLPG
jgi:hypothetical protein